MDLLYSVFFGAGIAAVAYTKMGKRLGFGNQKSLWITVGIAFVISTIFFYTLMAVVLNIH